jgi:hypothetical protein
VRSGSAGRDELVRSRRAWRCLTLLTHHALRRIIQDLLKALNQAVVSFSANPVAPEALAELIDLVAERQVTGESAISLRLNVRAEQILQAPRLGNYWQSSSAASKSSRRAPRPCNSTSPLAAC